MRKMFTSFVVAGILTVGNISAVASEYIKNTVDIVTQIDTKSKIKNNNYTQIGEYLDLLEKSYDKINLDVLFSDYKTALQEITQAKFASIPEYKIEGSYGPDHKKEFEVSIWIDGVNYGSANGKSKKLAQQAVAKIAIEKLKED